MYFENQNIINESWKQFNRVMTPSFERKHHYCKECSKQGYRVRMDYQGNDRQQEQYTMYNVDVYHCPRCNHIERETIRIEGSGKLGINSGKMCGSL